MFIELNSLYPGDDGNTAVVCAANQINYFYASSANSYDGDDTPCTVVFFAGSDTPVYVKETVNQVKALANSRNNSALSTY